MAGIGLLFASVYSFNKIVSTCRPSFSSAGGVCPQSSGACDPVAWYVSQFLSLVQDIERKNRKNHLQRIISFVANFPLFVGGALFVPEAARVGIAVYCIQSLREFRNVTYEFTQLREPYYGIVAEGHPVDQLRDLIPVTLMGCAVAFFVCHMLYAEYYHNDSTRKLSPGPLITAAIHMFGLVWLICSAIPAVLVFGHPYGRGLSALALISSIFGDIGAFYVGRKLGRHKSMRVISPNKSWEGNIASMSVTMMFTHLAFTWQAVEWLNLPPMSAWSYAMLGALIGVVSIFGDLVESFVKRCAGVKEAGSVFTGHGGVLDRFDTFFLVMPVLYCYEILVLS